MNRNSTLIRGLALAALTLLGAYFLLVLLVFGAIGVYQGISEQQYLGPALLVAVYLVLTGFEFALARKTIRTFKLWRQQP